MTNEDEGCQENCVGNMVCYLCTHQIYVTAIASCRTSELTGRGDYIQPTIQSIKLQNTRPALRFNDFVMLRLGKTTVIAGK